MTLDSGQQHTLEQEQGKLFVGGLSWETTVEKLTEYFSRYGEVIDCAVMKNPDTGRSRGFGFVTFQDPSIVQTVLTEGPHSLDGRTIDPKSCNAKGTHRGKKETKCMNFPKVFLGGLPANVNETSLREFFTKYGKVIEVVIMYNQEKKTNRGNGFRGFGFLSFESEESVNSLVAEHFVTINGKKVEVKKAEPRDRPSSVMGGLQLLAGSANMMQAHLMATSPTHMNGSYLSKSFSNGNILVPVSNGLSSSPSNQLSALTVAAALGSTVPGSNPSWLNHPFLHQHQHHLRASGPSASGSTPSMPSMGIHHIQSSTPSAVSPSTLQPALQWASSPGPSAAITPFPGLNPSNLWNHFTSQYASSYPNQTQWTQQGFPLGTTYPANSLGSNSFGTTLNYPLSARIPAVAAAQLAQLGSTLHHPPSPSGTSLTGPPVQPIVSLSQVLSGGHPSITVPMAGAAAPLTPNYNHELSAFGPTRLLSLAGGAFNTMDPHHHHPSTHSALISQTTRTTNQLQFHPYRRV